MNLPSPIGLNSGKIFAGAWAEAGARKISYASIGAGIPVFFSGFKKILKLSSANLTASDMFNFIADNWSQRKYALSDQTCFTVIAFHEITYHPNMILRYVLNMWILKQGKAWLTIVRLSMTFKITIPCAF